MQRRTNPPGIKNFYDPDVIRQSIHKSCAEILLCSSEILKFIFQKNGVVSRAELMQNYPEIRQLPILSFSVFELCDTIQGNAHFIPDVMQDDERVSAMMSSIARPIFMEEAQMMLQSRGCIAPNNSSNLQHNQQQAPSLEQSQYTIAGDETRDSDNDLSDL
ncbi:hypothetical protein [Candidatus Fokinia crypta]|uniref:Uncharacterized protein n=1 Tax=Candidatus Fokinia crypta TaxID=1920990 RepID=A0ABZ0URQ2_9RICK|nr:hypothetical protein [Candidatus Fokinia cryptica]WPX97936.1 hypothetical protein Fokcrypt_00460 [Candidatus Fokinia cryptica]